MNILPKACLFIFLVVNAIHSGSAVFKSKYGIKTIEYPKESCQRIDNVRGKGQCLGACVITVDKIVMISHDESTKTCMCCNDISGSDIVGPNWKSYALRTCKYWLLCITLQIKYMYTIEGVRKIPVPRDQVYFPWHILKIIFKITRRL